jgi:ATP synthase protein I
MEEDPFSARLKNLEDRIKSAERAREEPARDRRSEYTQGSLAWRMVTELVAGMLLGLGIGYGLDSLFGTRPVFLVLFALLGFAAGVRTMMRTAQDIQHGRSEAALMRGRDETQPDRNGPGEE